MHEVYTARYVHGTQGWQREGEIVLTRPQALEVPAGWTVAGNAFAELAGALPSHVPRVAG